LCEMMGSKNKSKSRRLFRYRFPHFERETGSTVPSLLPTRKCVRISFHFSVNADALYFRLTQVAAKGSDSNYTIELPFTANFRGSICIPIGRSQISDKADSMQHTTSVNLLIESDYECNTQITEGLEIDFSEGNYI
jgi:hypothetical protein